MKENEIFDLLFQIYTNNGFPGLKPIHFDDVEDAEKKFNDFGERLMLNNEAIEELYDIRMDYSNRFEKRGFICGIKLGAALMKEMGTGI